MILRLMIVAGLLSIVGACVVGPYEGRPAYYNGGGYNSGYNTGYDRPYYDSYGNNRGYYNGRVYQ